MFYLNVSVQFILKMVWIWLPCIVAIFVIVTYIKKDSKKLINLFNRIVNI